LGRARVKRQFQASERTDLGPGRLKIADQRIR
jgi:hypothetical protein